MMENLQCCTRFTMSVTHGSRKTDCVPWPVLEDFFFCKLASAHKIDRQLVEELFIDCTRALVSLFDSDGGTLDPAQEAKRSATFQLGMAALNFARAGTLQVLKIRSA